MSSESRRKEAREKLLAATNTIPADKPQPLEYIGLITRVLAFTLDLIVLNVFAFVTAAAVSLFFSVFNLPDNSKAAIAAVSATVYFLWVVGYFVTFWATTGQTPGDRVLRIKVVSSIPGPIKPRRALLRLGALLLGAIPLFAGYVLILFDDRRRAFHDHVGRTVVVDATYSRTPGVLARHREAPAADGSAEEDAQAAALHERAVLARPGGDEPDA